MRRRTLSALYLAVVVGLAISQVTGTRSPWVVLALLVVALPCGLVTLRRAVPDHHRPGPAHRRAPGGLPVPRRPVRPAVDCDRVGEHPYRRGTADPDRGALTRVVGMRSLGAAVASLPAVLLVACGSPEDGAFRGAVASQDGSPAAGCTLTVVPGPDVEAPVPEFAALTGGDGAYRYPLPPGTYEVTARCGDGLATATSTLTSGEETVLDLVID